MPDGVAWTVPGLDRITHNPAQMGGRACFRGLRITVGTILSLLAEGVPEDEILSDYPALSHEDIRQALAYAAKLARDEVLTI
jgi:uncharacterized protein (DUF433 family)